ncbi:MAG: hypothetical protein HY805_07990 [Nitrospirae bacterium]|nr:hypothetical protein [Nitrospirota bacterium]
MKKIALMLSLISILIMPGLAFSITCSEYFTSVKEIDVKIYSSAERTVSGFKYNYLLSSSQKSVQEVWSFYVEHYSPLVNATSPRGWSGMGTGITNGSPYSWASDEYESDEFNIKPGASLNGFGMQSEGLPAIVTYYAHGWRELPTISEEEMPEEEDCPERNIFINAFKGKTLGPTAPPLDFNPLSFLDYIIGMKHEAFSLGWITNKGIEMSLDAKLEAAKKKLEQGQNGTAKNILNALINEIEAQGCETYENCPKGNHLLPEAYALLKYNVLYLIERL